MPMILTLLACGSMGLYEDMVFDGKGRAEIVPEGAVTFESRPVGRGTSEAFLVESSGDIPITVEDAWVEVSDPNAFFVGALPFPKQLNPGETVEFNVNFEPQETGMIYGTLVVTMSDGSTLERTVSGAGCADDNNDGQCG